ncbi:hypothetical protein HOG21_00320 [bacterium]|jgi:hypothetical protein|nr:hypothetical protein [bacterium]
MIFYLKIIFIISLYAIIILNAIKKIKNRKWIIHSVFSLIAFLQNIFSIKPFIVIKINLHQSRAGIGNRLKTHRLIDIIAQSIIMNVIQASIELLIKSTTHIGPLTCFMASCLSLGVSGLNIFLIRIFIALNVSKA